MATRGTVIGVISNIVTIQVDGPVAQNEICYITTGGDRLMAEVIKVVGRNAYVQVFESTRGMKVGAEAEFTGHMLEVTLGPGMLSKNYDGLQNDLDKMEGVFLRRGQYTYPLDKDKKWHFKPIAKPGDTIGDSALWGDASGSGIAFQRLLVDYDIRSLYAADRRSVCRSYHHWSGHADTFLLRCMGTAQADQRAFLYGIFSHAASFQQQIVHGHSSFYH